MNEASDRDLACYFITGSHEKLTSQKDDIKDLKKDIKDVTTKLDAYLLARNLLDKLGVNKG